MSSKNLVLVAELTASTKELNLFSYTANVEIRNGSGDTLRIYALNAEKWRVANGGTITEIAGAFGEALDTAGPDPFVIRINGVWYFENRPLELSSQPERLVVLVPSQWQGDLQLRAQCLGHSTVTAELNGKFTAVVLRDATLEIADQTTRSLTRVELDARQGGSIECGSIDTTAQGAVILNATEEGKVDVRGHVLTSALYIDTAKGSAIQTTKVRTQVLTIASFSNSSATVGVIEGSQSATLHASEESCISLESLWMPRATCSSHQSGKIELGSLDAKEFTASALQRGTVTVRNGSCDSGKVTATQGGNVSLNGAFSVDELRATFGGSFAITTDSDTKLRLTSAAKRGFNYHIWEDVYSSLIALSLADCLLPLLQQERPEYLEEPLFIQCLCEAMPATFKNEAVVAAITACGAALRERMGPVEALIDKAKLAACVGHPEVLSLFATALAVFDNALIDEARERAIA